MTEPLIAHPSLGQRIDLLAVRRPELMRRNVWLFGILGLWSAIGSVTSLAVQHWAIAALTFATAALSTLLYWVCRRAMRRVPSTQRWIDELARGSGAVD